MLDRQVSLRAPGEADAVAPITLDKPEGVEEQPQFLVCAVCGEPITAEAARISVNGAHEHSFVNPHGIRYRIGCFAWARACVAEGSPSEEWTWFPPRTWQIQRCGRCRAHLGWRFESPGEHFYGLVLDQLRSAS